MALCNSFKEAVLVAFRLCANRRRIGSFLILRQIKKKHCWQLRGILLNIIKKWALVGIICKMYKIYQMYVKLQYIHKYTKGEYQKTYNKIYKNTTIQKYKNTIITNTKIETYKLKIFKTMQEANIHNIQKYKNAKMQK